MRTVVILGSSRSQGDTRQAVNYLLEEKGADLVDLNKYKISYYDYEHKNKEDDFLPLMKRIIKDYDCIIFATPVYWYSMSAIMKTFFDRISDLLSMEKDLGRQLRGKSMASISNSNADDLVAGFEMPFRESADYLGMTYLGHTHVWVNEGLVEEGKNRLDKIAI